MWHITGTAAEKEGSSFYVAFEFVLIWSTELLDYLD